MVEEKKRAIPQVVEQGPHLALTGLYPQPLWHGQNLLVELGHLQALQ